MSYINFKEEVYKAKIQFEIELKIMRDYLIKLRKIKIYLVIIFQMKSIVLKSLMAVF